jgi:hypothetical protein
MQSDDTTEPLDLQELRQSLREWATISAQMIDLLLSTAGSERSRNWQPHCAQIVKAVGEFGERCRSEAQTVGTWRAADGMDPDDAFEAIRSEGQRLVRWLQRMMAE